ncbi:class I SAM-dependent methyltransferase [Saccharomonospora piscinae]|uniref:class I SAM-dependent methyltransferase n=1 Tax=Saccharomonospora piscinae TaxID=687388 RepID=UPI0004650EAA|nr:class I SAM-dependent methyltransferase [Saccharomonospora piscinae]
MTTRPRWFTDTTPGHSEWYVERFRTMADEGADLAGEARLIDAMVPPGSRILDAGCGPGRVGAVLHERGHTVVGVDADPVLIEAAERDHPGPRWVVGDLATVDLALLGETEPVEPFDLAVVPGNVMVFLAPDSEREVLRHLRDCVRKGGRIVLGFRRERTYPFARFDDDVVAAGLTLEHRFATWELDPFTEDSDFAVSVLRVG